MENKCLLDDQTHYCEYNCDKCGWNPKEVKRRKKLFDKNGLTVCKNGLKRLIIGKPKEE